MATQPLNVYDVGRRLWHARSVVLACGVLAAVVAILFAFDISLSPPRLKPRALQLGVAGTNVLVDSRQSTLSDVHSNAGRLVSLAAQYAELANTAPIIDPIAQALHVVPSSIGVQVQITENVPLAQSQPLEPQVGTEILATRHRYYLVARNDSGTPVIQFYAQAPTGGQALTMATVASQALRRYIALEGRRGNISKANRALIRTIGVPSSGTLDHHVSEEAALLIFLLVWALATLAAIMLRGQARRSTARRPRADSVAA